MTMERADPFADLATEFAPKPKSAATPVAASTIDQLARENDFPSRQPVSSGASPANHEPVRRRHRRYVTGRNQQLNIRCSQETVDLFYRLADQHEVTQAELFEMALAALAQRRA